MIDNVKYLFISAFIFLAGKIAPIMEFFTAETIGLILEYSTYFFASAVGLVTLYKMRKEYKRKEKIDDLDIEIKRKRLEELNNMS